MGGLGGGGRGVDVEVRERKKIWVCLWPPNYGGGPPQNFEAAYGPEAYEEIINCTCITYIHCTHHTTVHSRP